VFWFDQKPDGHTHEKGESGSLGKARRKGDVLWCGVWKKEEEATEAERFWAGQAHALAAHCGYRNRFIILGRIGMEMGRGMTGAFGVIRLFIVLPRFLVCGEGLWDVRRQVTVC
jgi:hypothetical protein